jgi:hypothetical protein
MIDGLDAAEVTCASRLSDLSGVVLTMELFPRYVELKDTSLTCRRFEFEGFRSPGYCYLKVDIHDDVPVFYCTQLIHYRGRSIGVAEEDIRRRAITMLFDEGKVVSTRPRSGLARLFPRRFRQQQIRDIVDLFDEKSIWIRHYPAETSFWGNESYGLVYFADDFVHFTDLLTVMEITGLAPSFFHIDREELDFERG